MRKVFSLVLLLGLLISLISSCAPNVLRPFPYGKWENVDIGLVLDIDPMGAIQHEEQYHGKFMEDGEVIDVYVFFVITHGRIYILRESEWPSSGPDNHDSTIFGGTYRLRGDRLHYKLTPYWQEQTGITDTIIFEKIEEYYVPW